jgi:hypothetical protein
VADDILLFAYDALLDPDELARSAPSAEFLFTAHYPETRLDFTADGDGEPGPTLVRDPGHTVWGAVFLVPRSEADHLVSAMRGTGRVPGLQDQKAVDRDGNKHDCLTFVIPGEPVEQRPPAPYFEAMVRGARHWELPAGWVLGLEDLAEDSLSA